MAATIKDLGKVTAYAYAKAAGYTGTEEQFQAIFDEFTENAPGLIDRMDTAVARAEAAVADIDATVQDAVDDAVDEATASAVATANQAVTAAQTAQAAAEGAVTQANAAVTQANAAVSAAQAAQSAAEDAAESFVLDRTLTDSGAAAPADLVGDLMESINNTIVERLDGTVPIDISDIKNAFFSNHLNINNAGTAVTFQSSLITKILNRFCKVEANAEYELTITEGNVLSNDRARRLVLTDNNNLISKQFIYNPNAAQNDIITFKAEIDGYLCVGVDANFESVSIRRKSITDNPLPQSMVMTLGEMFKVTAYAQEATSQYNAFRKAFGIPLHPLANGTAITTGGDIYTVTNGNHVKLELVEETSGIPVLVNLLDISKNDGKNRNAGVVDNLPLAFSIPASSEVVYSLKNISGITHSIFYSSADAGRYMASNLRLVNSDTNALPKGAIVTADNLFVDNFYGIYHNFSGADIGSILLYLPKVKSACTIEFDVELLVNGDRYV